MEATVSEIHAYPARPDGFAEPLFHTRESCKRILEHFARSEWLSRATEAPRPEYRSPVNRGNNGGKGAPTYPVDEPSRVLASWREVDRWWEPDGGVDVVWRLFESVSGKHEVRAEAAPAQPVKPVS